MGWNGAIAPRHSSAAVPGLWLGGVGGNDRLNMLNQHPTTCNGVRPITPTTYDMGYLRSIGPPLKRHLQDTPPRWWAITTTPPSLGGFIFFGAMGF